MVGRAADLVVEVFGRYCGGAFIHHGGGEFSRFRRSIEECSRPY